MMITEEQDMYPVLKDYFEEKGYLVIVNQFSLLTPEVTSDIPDVVAVNWKQTNLLDTIAVECKLKEKSKISALKGIRQAIEYQICFPNVYVATQDEDIEYMEAFFEHVGIGHLTIDLVSNEVAETLPSKKGILHNESLFNLNIKDRLIFALIFRDMFEGDFRFGEMNKDGWVAKDFQNNVQFNCFYGAGGNVGAGLNLERKTGFRRVYKSFHTSKFSDFLKALSDDYVLGACIDLWPSGRFQWLFQDKQANKVTKNDLNVLVKKIETVLLRKKPTERPHLWIRRHEVWNNAQYLSREEYTEKIRSTFNKLRPILDYLES